MPLPPIGPALYQTGPPPRPGSCCGLLYRLIYADNVIAINLNPRDMVTFPSFRDIIVGLPGDLRGTSGIKIVFANKQDRELF